jgi:hypothetical protein
LIKWEIIRKSKSRGVLGLKIYEIGILVSSAKYLRKCVIGNASHKIDDSRRSFESQRSVS